MVLASSSAASYFIASASRSLRYKASPPKLCRRRMLATRSAARAFHATPGPVFPSATRRAARPRPAATTGSAIRGHRARAGQPRRSAARQQLDQLVEVLLAVVQGGGLHALVLAVSADVEDVGREPGVAVGRDP